jgi:hypothetical protein
MFRIEKAAGDLTAQHDNAVLSTVEGYTCLVSANKDGTSTSCSLMKLKLLLRSGTILTCVDSRYLCNTCTSSSSRIEAYCLLCSYSTSLASTLYHVIIFANSM